jgi:hypothetical protein
VEYEVVERRCDKHWLLLVRSQSALGQMVGCRCRRTSSTITGTFETGTPTAPTLTATSRLPGCRTTNSTSASCSTYARSPATSSSAMSTYPRSSCRGCRSYVVGPCLSSTYTTTSLRSSPPCARCTIWRCRHSGVSTCTIKSPIGIFQSSYRSKQRGSTSGAQLFEIQQSTLAAYVLALAIAQSPMARKFFQRAPTIKTL